MYSSHGFSIYTTHPTRGSLHLTRRGGTEEWNIDKGFTEKEENSISPMGLMPANPRDEKPTDTKLLVSGKYNGTGGLQNATRANTSVRTWMKIDLIEHRRPRWRLVGGERTTTAASKVPDSPGPEMQDLDRNYFVGR